MTPDEQQTVTLTVEELTAKIAELEEAVRYWQRKWVAEEQRATQYLGWVSELENKRYFGV